MDIIEQNKDANELWDDFCLTSPYAWFYHTPDFLEYQLNYNPKLKSKNLSFYFMQDKQIQCICPLFLEYHNDLSSYEFSFGGGYNPNPAFSPKLNQNQQIRLERLVFEYIDKKARELNVQRARYAVNPLSERIMYGSTKANWLLPYGYLDNSILSTIVNLNKDIDEIWVNARKRIKRAVNSMKKKLKINFYSSKNMSNSNFKNYQNMHLKAAGRVTRPQKTWDVMKKWIKNDQSILISAELNGEEIGFALFILYKKTAYYGSGANDPNRSDLPIMHFMFWKVLEWLKENQYNFFEFGVFNYPSLSEIPSPKEEQIANFKMGFGGEIYPVFRGDKYYSKTYCEKQITDKIKHYLNYLEDLNSKK